MRITGPLSDFKCSFLDKSGVAVGATGALVVMRRVDGDRRRALSEQHFGKKAEKSSAVTMPKHCRLADKGVDGHSSARKVCEVGLGPGLHGIGLCVCEGAPHMLHDPLPHQRLVQIL